jgi:hypothetical protein
LQHVADRAVAVDRDEARLVTVDVLGEPRDRRVHALSHRRSEVDEEHELVDVVDVEERKLLHVAEHPNRGLRERREVDALLPLARGKEEHLQGEDRLARPGRARDDRHRARRDAAAEDLVERGVAGALAFYRRAVDHGASMVPKSSAFLSSGFA